MRYIFQFNRLLGFLMLTRLIFVWLILVVLNTVYGNRWSFDYPFWYGTLLGECGRVFASKDTIAAIYSDTALKTTAIAVIVVFLATPLILPKEIFIVWLIALGELLIMDWLSMFLIGAS